MKILVRMLQNDTPYDIEFPDLSYSQSPLFDYESKEQLI